MVTVNEPKGSFWRDVLKSLGIIKDLENDPPALDDKRRGPSLPAPLSDVLDFGNFIALQLPAEAPNRHANIKTKESFAGSVAQKVRESLSTFGIESYDLIELYTPGETESIIMNVYNTEALINTFQRICETEIFGLGDFGDDEAADRQRKVHLVQRRLTFHPAFDRVLQKRLIVRPVPQGKVPVPVSPTDIDKEADQILVGLLQIFNMDGKRLGGAPIWAWRGMRDQNNIIIDVDFDLMTRAFNPDMHYFPLGLNIRCAFKQIGQKRQIEQVAMEIQEAKHWIQYLKQAAAADAVAYTFEIGKGYESSKYPLQDHDPDSIDVKKEELNTAFSLGEGRDISINRQLSINVKAKDKTHIYRFGFFDRALNYVPKRNIMRVAGQLIPEGEAVDVMLPPGHPDYKQTPIFRLSPVAEQQGHFNLKVLENVDLDLTLNNDRELFPGEEVQVIEGDEIRAKSDVKVGRRKESDFTFRLGNLSRIPDEICNRRGRKYSAFVEINAPREFILFDVEHVFGRGQFFDERSYGIESGALKFKRPWVFLTMSPAENQDIFYLNKAAKSADKVMKRLEMEGIQLELNADYEIYLGDYQINLNLTATPLSTDI